MKAEGRVKIQIAALLAFIVCAAVGYSRARSSDQQDQKPLTAPTALWRPRKEVKGGRFVGSKACAECHEKISAVQHQTLMAKALTHPSSCQILAANKELTLRDGPYAYRILRQGNRSLYTVTDGAKTFSEPILYCFGQGKAGQTYLFQHDGSFYESRMSYFKEIKGLDYTIGYTRAAPPTLEEAAGRAISADEAQNCFSCHATGAVADNSLQLERMTPGVGCEACHGPGERHIVAMKTKEVDLHIFNPANLDTDELAQEFCGACHRSVDEVSHMKNLGGGINNVRFQPYRLFNSPGHNPTDPRLSCTACHDPHDNPSSEAAFYDAKCFACHQSGSASGQRAVKTAASQERTAKPCPKSNKLCVSCHMPQVEIPGSHFKFTDHRIRIARPDDPYPN